jgi:hypothetical protein
MTYTNYIRRQRELIRDRHVGEMFLFSGGTVSSIVSTEVLFEQLNNLKGLNTAERQVYSENITRRGQVKIRRRA